MSPAVFPPSVMIGGVKGEAAYDYVGEEGDELSFKAGGGGGRAGLVPRRVLTGGREGFYPANYVEIAE
ncbi:unnamed protein product [Gadus morhua 'NCC']